MPGEIEVKPSWIQTLGFSHQTKAINNRQTLSINLGSFDRCRSKGLGAIDLHIHQIDIVDFRVKTNAVRHGDRGTALTGHSDYRSPDPSLD
jgi:hypothetical protein